MGWRSGKLSSWAVGTWILSICFAHPAIPPASRVQHSLRKSSPNELSGIDRALNWYTFGRNVSLMLLWYSPVPLLKTFLNIYCWTWIQTWTASASASAPLRPNKTLPRLTHPIQSFRYYHTATYRLSQTRVQESPCAPSDEAEDFKRSSRSETSSLKQKGFSREMLGSHVENVGIKASQARASYSRSGERGGAKGLNSLVGTSVGSVAPPPFHCRAAHRMVPAPQQVYTECRPRM